MIIRQRSLWVILWLALTWVVCASTGAETIRLKNGRIFEGEIAEEGSAEVKIIMKSGLVTFSRDEIESIGDRQISKKEIKEAVKSLSTSAPIKKPVAKKTTKSVPPVANPAYKKQPKSVKKSKKQVVPRKEVVKTESVPAVIADTATVTTLSTSTETVTSVSSAPIALPAALPARPKKGLTPSAKAAIVTMAIAVIALIVLMIKRISKQPKNK